MYSSPEFIRKIIFANVACVQLYRPIYVSILIKNNFIDIHSYINTYKKIKHSAVK